MIRSEIMLRWIVALAATIYAFGSAHAADLPNSGYGNAPRYGRQVVVTEESDLLFTPQSSAFPVIVIPPHTPILLGSTTLPGYYGSTHSYDYQGPYYGGPNIDFRYRLPYACGVLGYYCN
jgi:hypothetical protein